MSVFMNKDGRGVLLAMVKGIQDNKQYLGDVDGLIGDGDHGMNMNKGFTLYEEQLGDEETTFSDGLFDLGNVLLTKIGGSMGPIYGTLLMGMSDAEDDEDEITLELLAKMFEQGLSDLQEIVDAGIPYVAFDRIIDAVSSTAVSNVKGDNSGIGVAAASYFTGLGMKPGDAVYVYEGDTSSVTTLRDQGFTDYLKGNAEFEGKKIDDDLKWSDDDLKNITYSGAMNWSRSDTKTSFESLMGDPKNADIKWIYAEDDELAMGVLEALNGGGIDDATKQKFLDNGPAMTGCGGLDEYYEVLRGNSYQDIAKKFSGLCSVTYSPAMIQTAIQDMVDHLDGKEVTQDHVIACENVTADNVADYPSF